MLLPRLQRAKILTGFKLCATTRNNIQQHVTGCANGHNILTSNIVGSILRDPGAVSLVRKNG